MKEPAISLRWRSLLAAAVAGISGCALLAGYIAIAGKTEIVDTFVGTLPLALALVLPPALLVGWPAFLIINALGHARWWSAVCAGATLGAFCALFVLSPASLALAIVPIGGAAGGIFWLTLGALDPTKYATS